MADKIKVLMIDDEEDLNLMVKENLEETGDFEVITATDSTKAVELCLQELPNVVLLDNVMPGKQGAEIAKVLKEDNRTQDIPVIMVSGKGEFTYSFRREQFRWEPNRPIVRQRGEIKDGHSHKELAKAYGVDDYLSKPFTTEILIMVIKEVLEKNRRHYKNKDNGTGLL